MTERSIDHGTFTVTRALAAAPARVWRAFADPADKRAWFVDTPGFITRDYRLDCTDGGTEFWDGDAPDGAAITMSARFAEVRPEQRILMTYEMTMNGRRLSLSLLTVEFRPRGAGTDLVLTEHVVHLDGLGRLADRKAGTEALMDALARHLGG
jgi:uncharacterized protein YndB with AHSA1/START domain